MKKNVALVFGITGDFVFALANTLIGLKKHNQVFWDDVIVLHDGVSNTEQEALQKILPIKFKDMSRDETFCKILKTQSEDILKKYSIAAFYRYECLRLLNNYKRVIWNDVDILIKGDISELCDYAGKSGLALSLALPQFTLASSCKELILDYDMFVPLWNDGVMILSDKLPRFNEAYQWCIEATIHYSDRMRWPDLAILNLMIQEFHYEVENVDGNTYVCLPSSEYIEDAVVLHAYGDAKFWNNLDYMEKNAEWVENAMEWSRILYGEMIKKDKSPKISCIMSCYERYDFLDEAVKSILAQTFPNFELIVVLEKAKNQDKIEKFLRAYDDPRIKVIRNRKKLGFSTSLNIGIDNADGQYIARMDDDDISIPQRFALQLAQFEKNPKIDIVGSNIQVFGRYSGEIFVYSKHCEIKAATLVTTPFMHPSVMMRKKFLNKNNLRYSLDYFTEDYELWSRAVYLGETMNIPRSLVFYRSHGQQATNSLTSSNENKIHDSHKRVMRGQLKKYLHLDLTDNEIESIQKRKQYILSDEDGLEDLRNKTVGKILKANEKYQVYSQDALCEVFDFIVTEVDATEKSENKYIGIKKYMRKVIKIVVWPVYGRLMDRIEKNIVNKQNEILRQDMQMQINMLNDKIDCKNK